MITTTIILPISRSQYLDRVFASLEFLKCKKDNTNLLIYVDGDQKLYEVARNYTVNSKFNQKICIYGGKGNTNIANVHRRRERISEIHNEIKSEIKECEFVFLIEDDTVLPDTSLRYLLSDYRLHPHAGLISGMQLGRWGYLHIGGWEVDDLYNPSKITSIKVPQEFREIDAAGLYCLLTRKEHYLKHDFKPFDTILGPDFDFGITLRQQGFKNYIDPRIKCGHITPKEVIEFHNSKVIQVEFNRDKVSKSGWALTPIIDITTSRAE